MFSEGQRTPKHADYWLTQRRSDGEFTPPSESAVAEPNTRTEQLGPRVQLSIPPGSTVPHRTYPGVRADQVWIVTGSICNASGHSILLEIA